MYLCMFGFGWLHNFRVGRSTWHASEVSGEVEEDEDARTQAGKTRKAMMKTIL